MQIHYGYLLSLGERYFPGIVHDNPTAMGEYPSVNLPLTKFLIEFINLNEMKARKVAFADDFSVTGSLKLIKLFGQTNSNWSKIRLLP